MVRAIELVVSEGTACEKNEIRKGSGSGTKPVKARPIRESVFGSEKKKNQSQNRRRQERELMHGQRSKQKERERIKEAPAKKPNGMQRDAREKNNKAGDRDIRIKGLGGVLQK